MRKLTVFTAVAISLAVVGCTRSTDALQVNTQAPPQPLPSAPSGDLQTSELQQLPANSDPLQSPAPETPQAPTIAGTEVNNAQVDTASLDTSNAKPVTHETMTGAWNVNSDNPDCRVFLSFTKWSGGYRAGTRRCNAPELASVSAWDVKGSQVVLVDSNGSQVASLGSAGAERYAGTTAGGKPITFSR